MTPRYALSPRDLSTLLAMRGQRLLRDFDRQRAQLRAAGAPGPCVPVRPTPVQRPAPLPFKVHHG